MNARHVVLFFSVGLNCILLYTLIWGNSGAIAYQELRVHHDFLKQQLEEIDAKNIAISKEIRLLQSDEKYIEKMIRNRLNFVRENEILYIFPDEQKTESSGVLPHEAEN